MIFVDQFIFIFTLDYKFVEDFLTNSGKYYQASLERLNFADGEAARRVINTWVAAQTNQKIKRLIPHGVLNAKTDMVLANAIYFKGRTQCYHSIMLALIILDILEIRGQFTPAVF